MSNYIFEKTETAYVNNRKVNLYNVYQTKIEEESEIIEECEVPGITVVTSTSKVINVNASDKVKILIGKTYGKNQQEAEERYFNQDEDEDFDEDFSE